ncbi:MAG: YbaN family protein [Pseudomonadota bacterium]
MRTVWFIGGILSFAFGFLGAFLPFLPTVPLMILAAFCFARSSDRFHKWLITHPTFGPPIVDWRERGAISKKGKTLSFIAITIALGISVAIQLPTYALLLQALVMSAVIIFIWTRPS